MRKSLNDLQQIENYIFGRMPVAEQQAFYVRLLTENGLQEDIDKQLEAYAVIRAFGRQKLKAELEAVYQKQYSIPEHRSFFDKIKQLFTRK